MELSHVYDLHGIGVLWSVTSLIEWVLSLSLSVSPLIL